jgi:hypothetical protein
MQLLEKVLMESFPKTYCLTLPRNVWELFVFGPGCSISVGCNVSSPPWTSRPATTELLSNIPLLNVIVIVTIN